MSNEPRTLLRAARNLADEIAARPNFGETAAPLEDLTRMGELGLLAAPLPTAEGGRGWGTEAGGHLPLLRLLAIIGSGDLALGRLFEGHANALILIARFGTPAQVSRAADDVRAGRLFGVWNTGARELLRLEEEDGVLSYQGIKTFASGAAFVQRPIVTAERSGGWQMTVPRMDTDEMTSAIRLDRSFWRPLGMEASESYSVDFTGCTLPADDLLGAPGDFYADPLFRGGAIRFAAVQAGAVLRLHRMFAAWLEDKGRGDDPYQLARLADVALAAQESVLWVERAAAVAEQGMAPGADKLACEQMVECAAMTRVAVERSATAAMAKVVAGVGAHGLLQPARFERLVRDLTMYLRQPAPDETLAGIGRASLRKEKLRVDGAGQGLWQMDLEGGSVPAAYFDRLYTQTRDPWQFETSEYEAGKYRNTLAALPLNRYENALEVGCSIGVLTADLAPRCGALLSLDVSDKAIAVARERCALLPQVRFARMQFPQEAPDGRFDLVLLSEVCYYWQHTELAVAASLLAAQQPAGGHLVLVHHTPAVPDYPLTGDEVHTFWLGRPEWATLRDEHFEGYRLTVLERRADAAAHA